MTDTTDILGVPVSYVRAFAAVMIKLGPLSLGRYPLFPRERGMLLRQGIYAQFGRAFVLYAGGGHTWFALGGHGLGFRDRRRAWIPFSERYGYVRVWSVGSYNVTAVKRTRSLKQAA